jgi:hypothetical protein
MASARDIVLNPSGRAFVNNARYRYERWQNAVLQGKARPVDCTADDGRASAVRREAPIVLALTALLTIVSLLPRAARLRVPGASSVGLLFVTCLALAL